MVVAIPGKLFTANQSSNAISFNLLHKTDGSRLRQQSICQKEGVVVERDDMVKGYEFAKDQYARFTPEETAQILGAEVARPPQYQRVGPALWPGAALRG